MIRALIWALIESLHSVIFEIQVFELARACASLGKENAKRRLAGARHLSDEALIICNTYMGNLGNWGFTKGTSTDLARSHRLPEGK